MEYCLIRNRRPSEERVMREATPLGETTMEAGEQAISVRSASGSERPLIESLSQFYIYDFSEIEPPGSANLEFGAQGGYSPLPDLNLYWRNEGFHPLLIRLEEWLVGFALINTRVPSRRKHRAQPGGVLRNIQRLDQLLPWNWKLSAQKLVA